MRNHKRLVAAGVASLLLLPSLCYWTIYYDLVSTSAGTVDNRWAATEQMTTNLTSDHAAFISSSGSSDKYAFPTLEHLNFERFDNDSGGSFGGLLIIPNVIHYIRFNKTSFTFVDYICLRSAFVNQNPDKIYLHTNVAAFSGKYWKRIKSESALYSRIVILPIELPLEIFGQALSKEWRLYHGSDIARIRTMMKYGGIYLDNDVYVVQNLDKYRKFELVMGWDEGQFLGSQVILAHKDARFLPQWLNTYSEYRSDLWYYNAGERPTREVLYHHPELCHRVKLRFGVHMLMRELYDTADWSDWKSQDTIHLLINHRSYLDPHYKEFPEFDEQNIRHYPFTFGQMARLMINVKI